MNIVKWAGQTYQRAVSVLQAIDNRNGYGRGWWPVIRESFSGAWQRNIEWSRETVSAHFAVYRCVTLISNDIGNMPAVIKEKDSQGIWIEVDITSKSPVLRRPNRYQNHIQFKQWWAMSKLTHGNMYGLKVRDNRGEVVEIFILDPCGAQVLVSPDGSIYYQFKADNLTGITDEDVYIPASEIIHDRMNCLFHPLVGISPLFACGAAAANGLKMQSDSFHFFANGANPGGVLTAPGAISDETAKRLQEKWTANYTGDNAGNVAVMGDGLKFEPMRMKYVDAQYIEQLKFSAETVCAAFGVPLYKVNLGPLPSGMKPSDIELMYYNNALHTPIEEMELCLDQALSLDGRTRRVELDLETLLRMDPATQAAVQTQLVDGAIATPNEARRVFNKKPLAGGDTVYMQQQNYSLEALNKRDQKTDPFGATPPAAPIAATPADEEDDEMITEEQVRSFFDTLNKGLQDA